MKKPEIDKMLCMKCGMCASVCPNIFKFMPGEPAVVKNRDEYESETAMIDQAIAFCPAGAISWEDQPAE